MLLSISKATAIAFQELLVEEGGEIHITLPSSRKCHKTSVGLFEEAAVWQAWNKMEAYALQDIETMVNTNVLAASLLVRLFCTGMVERNKGHIINISSIAAKQRYPGKAF